MNPKPTEEAESESLAGSKAAVRRARLRADERASASGTGLAQAVNSEAPPRVARVIAAAGGNVAGRARLQKLAYLLELAGFGEGFHFTYHHYGPFSEDLAMATRDAVLLGLVHESEVPTSWGGFYSIYSTHVPGEHPERAALANLVNQANPIELELAASAAYLATEDGVVEPWSETARRKPEKADAERLLRAQALYRQLRSCATPRELPAI